MEETYKKCLLCTNPLYSLCWTTPY